MKRRSRCIELVNLATRDTDHKIIASTPGENAIGLKTKRWSRGTKLVNLATRDNDDKFIASTSGENAIGPSSKPPEITIQKEEIVILDDKSGKFILQDAPSPEKTCIGNDNNYILDENTGQLIPISPTSQSDSQDDFSASDDTTDYKCSDYSSSSTASDLDTLSTLDETSGHILRKRAKKGQPKTSKWLRNKVKISRQKGKEYVSIKRKKGEGIIGKIVREQRKMNPPCFSVKCAQSKANKCHEISNENRAKIFHTFWDVLSWEQRKLYVNAMVVLKPIQKQTTGAPSKRSHTLDYHLKVDGEMMRVCKTMFLNTLCLGEWSVSNWVKKAKNDICMVAKDPPMKKISSINEKKIEHIQRFLNAVPKMPSHYCRKNSSKLYVDLDYRTWTDLYQKFVTYIKENHIPDDEKATYKCFLTIVHKMNLGIYRPKKDQCDLCYAYKSNNVEEEKYQKHIQAKDRARQERDKDKERCLKDEVQLFTVDLQAVQNIPSISAGAQYFKLKLCVHQFTIYNENDGSVVCYVWHEGEGGVDSNVFTSCIIDFLEGLENKTKPIIIFSDGCGYQNRNVTLSNALQNFAIKYKAEIYQKYLEVGHTQMSCDSVHATIELKKKHKELFVPADFVQVIKAARSENPYHVRYLSHEFFHNYGASFGYYKSIRPGKKPGDPCVVDLRVIKYTESGINYKLKFDEDWTLLPQRFNRPSSCEVERLYDQQLPITKRKMDDLQSMKELLPKDYHSFYDTLIYEG